MFFSLEETIIPFNFLKKFRDLILERIKLGEKFIFVIGGGATCRQYQTALKEVGVVDNENLDYFPKGSKWNLLMRSVSKTD